MSYRKTLLLLFLNALVIGLGFWLDRPKQDDRLKSSLIFTLLGPDFGLIQQLEISGKGMPTKRVLSFSDEIWKIQSPIEWPANPFAIKHILGQLVLLQKNVGFPVSELDAAGQTLADYGLEDPHLILKVSSADSHWELKFGQPATIENRVYLLTPDQQYIWVVGKELIESLCVDLENLRNQSIFDIPLFEVKSFKIRNENVSAATLLEKKEDEWYFEAPLQAPADSHKVESMLTYLLGLQVDGFVSTSSQDLSKYGLEQPKMIITIYGNKRQQALLIGKPVKDEKASHAYFAKLENNPTIFKITKEFLTELQSVQDHFRERKFLKIEADTLDKIEVSDSQQTITLQKLEKGSWQVLERGPDATLSIKKADADLIYSLIQNLSELKVAQFISDAPSAADKEIFGLKEPQRILKLSGTETKTLCLGNLDKASNLLYARLREIPYVYKIEPNILSYFPTIACYYRDRLAYKLPELAKVRSWKLVDLEKAQILFEQTLINEAGEEIALSDMLTSNQQAAATVVMSYIKAFKVKNYLKDEFDLTFCPTDGVSVPWKYVLEAEIFLPSGADETQKLQYYFTEPASAVFQGGGSSTLNCLFTLEADLINSLKEIGESKYVEQSSKLGK
jgi:hypothetical protein